jgi:ribosomal protein S18 acetylase RimI-like enzyme
MATVPELRGRGAGTAVLRALIEHAESQGATRIWASVRTPARSLYERAGLLAVSDVFETPDIGPHLIVSREV